MIAAVTGATGFIGRALALRLAASGVSVLALVRDLARAGELASTPGIELVRGDLRDREVLRDLAGRAGVIYHLAGLTSARNRAEFMAVNAEVTGALAAAAASSPAPPKLVLVSSLSVAGPRTATRPAREDDPPAPVNAYGESKLLGEELLRRQGARVRWTIVRPPWVYGPGDRATLALFRLAARGLFPSVRGGCMQISLVHVHDLVEALALAGDAAQADGRVYYAADGVVHTVAQFGQALLAACGGGRALHVPGSVFRFMGMAGEAAAWLARRPPLLGRDKACEGLQQGWVCDDARIRAELGYRSRVGLEAGVVETLAWYRTRGWL
ncbi:MAG: NAD-dependent epimerase/dehydratase family protein [Candidatus Methylomirabilia bacterium]